MTRSLLIVALDAELRGATFERLAAAGYRVDAVANPIAAKKRLAKDRYPLIVVEVGLDLPPGAPPRLEVSLALLDEGSQLEREVERLLGRETKEP